MAHLVYLAALDQLVYVVPKVSVNIQIITSVPHYFNIHKLTDVLWCSGQPGDSYGYPGGPGAKGLQGDSGYTGDTHTLQRGVSVCQKDVLQNREVVSFQGVVALMAPLATMAFQEARVSPDQRVALVREDGQE